MFLIKFASEKRSLSRPEYDMHSRPTALLLFLLFLLSSSPVRAQYSASDGYEKLKSLEGEWTGIGPNDLQLSVTYQIVSGGQAVIETRVPVGEPSMVTVFHLDGDSLMMTHYCSAGNQPRMRTTVLSKNIIDFTKVDVTNLASASEGHMQGLRFEFEDDMHFRQLWTWRQDGADLPAAFQLQRVNE